MSDDGHLTHGWEPATPPTDTLHRAAIENQVRLVTHLAERLGGRALVDERMAVADLGSPSPFLNGAVFRTPVVRADDERLDEIDAFYRDGDPDGGPGVLFSPWPSADLRERGWQLGGHPPLMYLTPGATAPAAPRDLRIERVGDGADAEQFSQVLVDGYPVDELRPYRPGTFFRDAAFAGSMRGWVGFVEDRPVAASLALEDDHLIGVHFVATLPEGRGRGFGEALTWAATQPDAERPSYLVSSDLGRPVYERMGYVAFTRFTIWIVPRP